MKKTTCKECGKGKLISYGGSIPECDHCGHHEYPTQATVRTEVREIEKHVKSMAPNKSARLAIISKAQGVVAGDERSLSILAIVKNRIIRE